MTNDIFTFSHTHLFTVPQTRLWQAWSDAEQLKAWYGPKGCEVFHSTLDLKPGGIFHHGMKFPNGGEMWGKWVFQDIIPVEQLRFTMAFSNKDGKTIPNPWQDDSPLEVLCAVTLTAKDGKTEMRLESGAYNATDAQRKTFDNPDGQNSMRQGWKGAFEKLEALLY